MTNTTSTRFSLDNIAGYADDDPRALAVIYNALATAVTTPGKHTFRGIGTSVDAAIWTLDVIADDPDVDTSGTVYTIDRPNRLTLTVTTTAN